LISRRQPVGNLSGYRTRLASVRVLVIGSGAREHALCLALSQDPALTHLVCAPGNAGTAAVAEQRPVDVTDPAAIAALAVALDAGLVVVGPEVPLVAGAADAVRAAGIPCFGPGAGAARIEGSKAFAKDVMAAAGVPTGASRVCADPAAVAAALDEFGPPYVVKDDGLAAGKGVLVTEDRAAALAHAARCPRVVVEEYLDGPEVSLFAITDGTGVLAMLPAQDFKRIGDGDAGPNTGGMGAYAPLPWAPPGLADQVLAEVVRPCLAELARRGTPFTGALYAGLALTKAGVRVIEFNCRFGDPETQAVLALLETPLAGLLHAAATGGLADHPPLAWRDGAAVTVVLAAAGYPGAPRGDDPIEGAGLPGVLHAGTRAASDGSTRTAGGRVLSPTAIGADLSEARAAAYRLVDRVSFPGMQYRTDIALRAATGEITLP
jgi:phosphoribosylamine--glycine ligase